MANRHGLNLLYASEDAKVDIVFVHGLFGHPEKTWTWHGPIEKNSNNLSAEIELPPSRTPSPRPKQRRKLWPFGSSSKDRAVISEVPIPNDTSDKEVRVFWPKTLLPQAIPQSRIYTWGYDADINHVFAAPGQATVFQHAGSLLSDLADNRITEEDKARPIIFVAHSLGGIIVKDMLNASRNEVTYLKEILPSTYGVVYFGTPHRGSATASIGKIAHTITKALGNCPNTQILRDLEVNSETLDRIGRGFQQILAQQPIQIHSFREEVPVHGIMIVNNFSSTIEHGLEVVSSIPANHKDMVKFSSASDIGFVRLEAVLKRWTSQIVETRKQNGGHEQVLVNLLQPIRSRDIEETNDIITVLPNEITEKLDPATFEVEMAQRTYDRCPGTGAWLLSDDRFLRFLTSGESTAIHVVGGPGSGKTFLMSLVVDSLQERFQSNTEVSTTHFFCDSKTEDVSKRTSLAVVKTLIAQLLQQLSRTVPKFVKEVLTSLSIAIRPGMYGALGLFYTYLEKCLNHFQVNYIVIDALDECVDWNEILKALSRLSQRTKGTLKFLLSSQNTAGIPHSVSRIPSQESFRVDIDNNTDHMELDIARYVRWRMPFDVRSLGTVDEAVQLLFKGSMGLFIMARLKLDILENEILPHEMDVKKAVESLPDGIHAYYERSLLRLSPANLAIAQRMFEWIVYSQRPLTVRELGIVCIDEFDVSNHEQKGALTIQGIESLGAGLIKMIDDKVHLSHSTVKQFLIAFNWNNDTPDETMIQSRLVGTCISYLSMPLLVTDIESAMGLPPNLEQKFPFADYAAYYWIEHLRLSSTTAANSELVARIPQFLDGNSGISWWLLYTSLVEDDNWWSLPQLTSTWLDWLNRQTIVDSGLKSKEELMERLCEQHLKLFEAANSRGTVDIPKYIRALIRLASTKYLSMDMEISHKLNKRALKECQKLSEPKKTFWKCRVLYEMAELRQADGDYEGTLSICDEVLAFPEIRQKENVRVFLGIRQLQGDTRQKLRHLDISESILRAGFEDSLKLLNENDPTVLSMRNALAITLIELERVEEARELLDITHYELALGKDHPSTLIGMENVANLLEIEGKNDEAFEMIRHAWERRQETGRQSSFDTITTGLAYSRHLRSQGKAEESMELQKTLLDRITEIVGEEHYMKLHVEEEYAYALGVDRRMELALQHQERILKLHRERLGENHWTTIRAKCAVATTYERLARYDESEILRVETLETLQKDPDITYLDICTMKSNLAILKSCQDQVDEAHVLQLEVVATFEQYEAKGTRLLHARSYLGRLKSRLCLYKEAESLQREVIKIREETHEPDDSVIILAKERLATVVKAMGNLDETLMLNEDVLDAYRKRGTADSPAGLEALRTLATTKQAQKQLKEAEQIFQSVLEKLKDKGDDKPRILAVMQELALVKQSLGDPKEARRIFYEVMDEYLLDNPDPNAPQILSLKYDLSEILQVSDQLGEAEEMIREVIETRKAVMGPNAHLVICAQDRLANILQDAGKLEEAAELQEYTMEKRRELEGEDSPNLLIQKGNLALTRYNQGQMEEATRLQTEVVVAYRQAVLGKHDEESSSRLLVADAAVSLAWTKAKMRRLFEASELQQEALDIYRKVLHERSVTVLDATSRLASIKAQIGQAEESEILQTEVVNAYRLAKDSDATCLGGALNNLAWTKHILEKHEEAKVLAAEALEIHQKLYGDESRATLVSYNRLSKYMSILGELTEAKEMQLATMEKWIAIGSSTYEEALVLRLDLANTLSDLEEYSEAEKWQQEVLTIRRATSDEDNFDVLRTLTEIAHLKHRMGKLDEEEDILTQVAESCRRRCTSDDTQDLEMALYNLVFVKDDLGKHAEGDVLEAERLELEAKRKAA